MYSDEYLLRAYLRGTFLSVGSVNDPKKSRYHLEFMVNTKVYADFISKLLNTFNLNSKVLKRENRYMVYIKEAEKIGDFPSKAGHFRDAADYLYSYANL